MLQFDEVVNLREEISKGIQAEDWFRTSADELLSDTVWLVGRENDGVFLFRYNTSASQQTGGAGRLQTHIGICNLAENRVKTLLSLGVGKDENVVHCTTSEQTSLLAFCIASDGPIKARSPANKDMRLYIAEVQQGLRRNTVPIEIIAERLENTKSAQFIHKTGHERKAKLIIFEHSEYIGVLNLNLDSTGRLKDKPRNYKPNWIIGKHFWYKWDVDKQHLFTIAPDSNNDSIMLNVYQTSEKVTLQHLFLLPIDIDSKTTRPRLSRLNLEQRSQDRNIVLLTNSDSTNDGMMCLCNQVPYDRREKSEADLPFTLKYEILSFVHGKKFTVSVPNVPGKLRKSCIHFTLIGNYVLAYLPDVFTHLLNVQDIAELGVLNIISAGESHSRVADSRGVLSRVHITHLRRKRSGVFMYDSSCMGLYHMCLSDLALQDKFSEKWPSEPRTFPVFSTPADLTNQLAILQHVLQTTADAKRTRQLLECMKNDVTNSDTVEVLSEFILGSSFAVASRRSEMSKVFCRLIPFTCAPTERSHKVTVGGGEKKMAVSVHIQDSPTRLSICNDTIMGKDCHFFVFLFLVSTRRAVKRFDVSKVYRRLAKQSVSISRQRPSSSLKQKLYSLVRKDSSVRAEGPPTSPDAKDPYNLPVSDCFPDSLLNEDVDDRHITGLADALMEYIKDCYPPYNSKGYNSRANRPNLMFVDVRRQQREFETMCRAYAKILVNQSKVLLHHLYSIFELKELLNKQYAAHCKEDLHKAFLMFERYQMAVEDLGLPIPSEFPTLLTTIAFQSLNPVEFMQYVTNGTVELTDEFLAVLAVDNTPSKAIVKCECLTRMSHEQAVQWSHRLMNSPVVGSTATRLVADDIFNSYCGPHSTRPKGQQAMRKFPSSSSFTGGDESQEDVDSELPDSYSYMVKKLTASGWTPGTNGVTFPKLERAVFYHTKEQQDHPQLYLGIPG